jgi:hypothetical protein
MNEIKLWLPTDQEIIEAQTNHMWLDHSVANSLHTCPKYAMLRYINGMVMEGTGRAMSLEAGSAMHRAFAMHRLWWMNHKDSGEATDKIIATGLRIFGEGTDEGMWDDLSTWLNKPVEQACLHALYTSGFYDDDKDKVRTLSNLEESLLYYLGQMDLDECETLDVEVSLPFGIQYSSGERFIYLGRADALERVGDQIRIADYKTSTSASARGWEAQWHVSHQLTGYMIGASMILGEPVRRGRVLGLTPKLPAKPSGNNFRDIPTSRNDMQIQAFFEWVLEAWRKVEKFRDDPFSATTYTSACFSFFTPCMFIPVCTADEKPTDWTGFEHNPWHPTHGD